ncbi:MAG: hypothetical protein ABI784_01995 [Ginsengibacter sp.]
MKVIVSDFRKKSNIIPIILVLAGLLMAFHRPIIGLVSPAGIDVKIDHPPLIMPSAYKVYSNEDALNGKYSLFKMIITNNSSNAAQNVAVSFQIPGYIEWTEIKKLPVLLPGQSAVVNCYPAFDQKIVEKTTPSQEKVNIKITGSNIDEQEESFGIKITGRNELMYSFIKKDEIRTISDWFDNLVLLACFVTPEDPIIKYYTQKVQEKIMKGEAASVSGTDEDGIKFLLNLYYATVASHMVYSGTSGVPADIDDVSSTVQSIRIPREVVTGKTGLCIELSVLYASVLMSAGLDPVIFLVPHHAYPGIRVNGHLYAIEATGINGEGLGGVYSPKQAFQIGMARLAELDSATRAGSTAYTVLDVRDAIKRGAVAMELKDDAGLRRNIDEITQPWDQAGQRTVQQPQNVAPINQGEDGGGNQPGNDGGNNDGGNDGGNNGGNNSSVPSGYSVFQGPVTFAYPSSWRSAGKNPNSMPQLSNLISNSNNSAFVEVYNFNGAQSGEQCIQAIKQYIQSMGANFEYQSHGESRGYAVFNGRTSFNGQSILWMSAFKRTSNGMAGISTGYNTSAGTKYQKTASTILKSLQ